MTKPKPKSTTSTTLPPQAGAGLSPDMTALAKQLGIDPAALQSSASYYQQQDPPVWDGRETKRRSQAYVDFYTLNGDRLRQFQERAFNAGLYGTNLDRSQIRFGDHDDLSLAVWKSLVDRAVGYTATGQKVSPLDALDQAAANPAPTTITPPTQQVTNPLDIRDHLKAAAQATFGEGKLDEKQVEKFITSFQASQDQSQRTAYDQAHGTGGTSVAAPTVDAAADQFLHQSDPTRYDAHKAVGAIDQIAQLMRGGQ